ncbi:MAG: hypothetical protein K2Z81_24760, partial [Cyanobacteria bacterium]|nr:hypothetical protein [Cyanobacteriota bacterium]
YGAGNRAPQFYQTLFTDMASRRKAVDAESQVLSRHIVSIVKEARALGEPVSSADAISASQNAELLSRLRGRTVPILDDIHDAIITCCCKGDPETEGINLQKAMDRAGIGTAIGKVSPKVGRLPIVGDFYLHVEALELQSIFDKENRQKIELDKRKDLDNKRSTFLHRLVYLKIPVGGQTGRRINDFDSGKIFAESWSLGWSPEIEAELIERTLSGDTIESAAIESLRTAIAKASANAAQVCRELLNAIDMDIPDLVQSAYDSLSHAIDEDNRFVSLSEALGHLFVLEKYGDLRGLKQEALLDLIIRCFDRACFAILDVIAVPPDQEESVVAALTMLAEAMLRGEIFNLDRALFVEHVIQAHEASEVPFLKGAFFGMLLEMRERSSEDLAAEIIALTRSPVEKMLSAGDLLHGVMSVSRASILIGADALIQAIDELLKAAVWDDFLTMLPRLRSAFDKLSVSQRSGFAEQVAKKYGLVEATSLTEFITSTSVAAQLARIDGLVSDIMREWDF